MICFFYFRQKRLTLVLGVTQYCPPPPRALFYPIGPKKQKRFILANVFSELLHSNTNLTQLTENQPKQPICLCGPITVGLRLSPM